MKASVFRMVRRISAWVGARLVKWGLGMLDYKDTEFEEDVASVAPNQPTVRLSAEAGRMVQDGQRIDPGPPQVPESPLSGSVEERLVQARVKRERSGHE